MKGKDIFKSTEINQLIELIKLRCSGLGKSQQKKVRDRMRDIGFYGGDDWGVTNMTVEKFQKLITDGKIKVIDDSGLSSSISIDKAVSQTNVFREVVTSTDFTTILQRFKANRFDPLLDCESTIPDRAGNYILCLRSNSKLPKVSIEPTLKVFDGLQVIYTGIAGGSLRSRDYRQHFKGNNAGRSTLRKSLGVLFGYKQIPRDNDPTTGKTKFGFLDEINLTEWMCENLI